MDESAEPRKSLRKRVLAGLNEPVDIASLVFVRIAFGVVMFWEVTRYFDHGWIADYWIEPDFHFTYLGFDWVKPWPGDGMLYHFVGLGVLALMITCGVAWRFATTLFFVGFTYVFLLEQARYLNHFYLVCLLSFLIIFVPAHRSFSLGTRLGWVRPANTTPFWTVWVLRFQLAVVYVYGAIAKLNADWLAGEPMRTWLGKRNDMTLVGPLFDIEATIWVFVYGGILIDLLIVLFLVWKRTRLVAFLVVVVFHLFNSVVWSIGIFPFMAIALTTIFFEPGWPRRLFRFPVYGDEGLAEETPEPAESYSMRAKLIAGGLALYVAVQLLVPLRHWLYPGSVAWTEEGHKFSWRMKLRSRGGTTVFYVTDNQSGVRVKVDPGDHISDWQRDSMDTRVDMILQFVEYLREKAAAEGHDDVKITARSRVSLNYRKRQLFFDPELDLTTKKRTLWHQPWIYPLKEPLPKPE